MRISSCNSLMSEILGLEMIMYEDGTQVQVVATDERLILNNEDLEGAVGVYDSAVHLTEWGADMVIKVWLPQFNSNWVEVYANHREFKVIWKKKYEN
jgi:hypothetical protein